VTTFDRLIDKSWGPRSIPSDPSLDEGQQKLLEAIAHSAFNNLRAYSNCCRSTLWAIQTHFRILDAGTLVASSALAGGIGGTGETCGAVLGGLMAIGQALGSDVYQEVERDLVARAAAKIFVASFTDMIGSTRCYGVQESIVGWVCDDASKVSAWHEAKGPEGCAAACALAARLAAEQIMLHNESAS